MTMITASTSLYTATIDTDTMRVSISRETGEWSGDGRWNPDSCEIVDCAADLGDDAYAEIDCAIIDAIDEAEVSR